jgi:serine/threonine-protein kinase RsbW
MNSLRLQIPSIADNIRIVESFIDNARDEFQFDDNIYGNIMIAVTESVNNAIVHGNKLDNQKVVDLSMEIAPDNIRFVIHDQGDGFDYTRLPDPTAPENLMELGGRGIFLMRNLADEVSFSDQGRTVELTFFLEDPAISGSEPAGE